MKTNKGKKDRRSVRYLISDLLLLLCAIMFSYPFIADNLNRHKNNVEYTKYLKQVRDSDFDKIYDQVKEYNKTLVGKGDSRFSPSDTELEKYMQTMKLPDTDVIAYIDIDKIGIDKLPVYHTTNQSALQVGVGHYVGSSFPIGGKGTHCVLSGHTGMAGSPLFTELNNVEIGDTFKIYALGHEITYKVDSKTTVLPEDISGLDIDKDKSLCTLVTCTPLGINSHRLLVTGHQISDKDMVKEASDIKESKKKNTYAIYELLMLVVSFTIVFGVLIPDLTRMYICRKERKHYEKDK